MTRILITGSTTGLGLHAAQTLISHGHTVTLHARSSARASTALSSCPGAHACLIGSLSSIASTKALAAEIQSHGPFDVIMHNAGIGNATPFEKTEDGISMLFQVNVLAPYILTSLVGKNVTRLVYLSSGMHFSGSMDWEDLEWTRRRWSASQAYCDSKFWDTVLAFAVARRWRGEVQAHAVDPGWVRTRMGGEGAPLGIEEGVKTMVWLATTEDDVGSGKYWVEKKREEPRKEVKDAKVQDELLKRCRVLSGVEFPA